MSDKKCPHGQSYAAYADDLDVELYQFCDCCGAPMQHEAQFVLDDPECGLCPECEKGGRAMSDDPVMDQLLKRNVENAELRAQLAAAQANIRALVAELEKRDRENAAIGGRLLKCIFCKFVGTFAQLKEHSGAREKHPANERADRAEADALDAAAAQVAVLREMLQRWDSMGFDFWICDDEWSSKEPDQDDEREWVNLSAWTRTALAQPCPEADALLVKGKRYDALMIKLPRFIKKWKGKFGNGPVLEAAAFDKGRNCVLTALTQMLDAERKEAAKSLREALAATPPSAPAERSIRYILAKYIETETNEEARETLVNLQADVLRVLDAPAEPPAPYPGETDANRISHGG